MKSPHLTNNLVFLMPILCVVAASGIVLQESVRHDRLERQVAASESAYAKLEKRLKVLKQKSGDNSAITTETPHHHDGDGD